MALLRAGRKCPEFHCLSYSSSDETLKKFNSANRDTDLIISSQLIKGFEHYLIIDVAGFYNNWSRSSSKLIKVFPNLFLDMIFVLEKIFKDRHHCDQLMSLSDDEISPMTSSSLSTMLGESYSTSLIFPGY